MVNKCCYVSASVGQVSELMQQRQQSGCTTPLFAPLCQFLSFTFCPIIFHDFQKAPHITHTHTYTHTHADARRHTSHSFPGILGLHFLVLESFDLSDRTVKGDSQRKQNDTELVCPIKFLYFSDRPTSSQRGLLVHLPLLSHQTP